MYSKIFSGNLVGDAVYKKMEGDKSPISFSVAVNFSEDYTGYESCEYWILTVEKPKILEYLKKGAKVMIKSNFCRKTTNEKEGKVFQNEKTYVSGLEILFRG